MLKIVPAKVNKKAQYSFSFILEAGQNLSKSGKIDVKFPEGTTIPASLSASQILVGGKPVSSVEANGLELVLTSAVAVAEENAVDVVFKAEAGIVNTKEPGEVKLGYRVDGAGDYLMTTGVELIESRLEVSRR